MPKGRYIDREFLALELERLFPRVWQMACREEDIPEVGSYLEYEIGDQSVLVVRAAADPIRAFHNACIQRGTQLAKGHGRIEEFRCPFHGWRFDLDGRCSFMHCEDEFKPRPEASKRLAEVRCETWGGWVFVNMDLQGAQSGKPSPTHYQAQIRISNPAVLEDSGDTIPRARSAAWLVGCPAGAKLPSRRSGPRGRAP